MKTITKTEKILQGIEIFIFIFPKQKIIIVDNELSIHFSSIQELYSYILENFTKVLYDNKKKAKKELVDNGFVVYNIRGLKPLNWLYVL